MKQIDDVSLRGMLKRNCFHFLTGCQWFLKRSLNPDSITTNTIHFKQNSGHCSRNSDKFKFRWFLICQKFLEEKSSLIFDVALQRPSTIGTYPYHHQVLFCPVNWKAFFEKLMITFKTMKIIDPVKKVLPELTHYNSASY